MKLSRSVLFLGVGFLAAGAIHCSATPTEEGTEQRDTAGDPPKRDWSIAPAIAQGGADTTDIYALSDVHGDDAVASLLQNTGLIDASRRWIAPPTATLVVVGDLIDKGPDSLGVIDLLRSLQAQVPRHVIVTMGNHEAEFLADPMNDKARGSKELAGIDQELEKPHGAPPKEVARAADPEGRGRWLNNLPFGAKVKKWFFAHAGDTSKLSLDDLTAAIQKEIDDHGYSKVADGKSVLGRLLESEGWYGKDASQRPDEDGSGNLNKLDRSIEHIVFGHDPGAFGAHGKIEASKDGSLVKIDTAMGIDGKAFLLHVHTLGKDTAEVLDASGKVDKKLF